MLKNVDRLAVAAENSEQMIFPHYREWVTEACVDTFLRIGTPAKLATESTAVQAA